MTRKLTTRQIHDRLRALDNKANVGGWIVMRGAEHVGTVRLSYPRDGAGRLVAMAADWTAERPRAADGGADFTNWTPWQYGTADGGGYDKASAALAGVTVAGVTLKDEGRCWYDQLRAAGLSVLQAV